MDPAAELPPTVESLRSGTPPYSSFYLKRRPPATRPPATVLVVGLPLRRLVSEPRDVLSTLRAFRASVLDCTVVGQIDREVSPLEASALSRLAPMGIRAVVPEGFDSPTTIPLTFGLSVAFRRAA